MSTVKSRKIFAIISWHMSSFTEKPTFRKKPRTNFPHKGWRVHQVAAPRPEEHGGGGQGGGGQADCAGEVAQLNLAVEDI